MSDGRDVGTTLSSSGRAQIRDNLADQRPDHWSAAIAVHCAHRVTSAAAQKRLRGGNRESPGVKNLADTRDAVRLAPAIRRPARVNLMDAEELFLKSAEQHDGPHRVAERNLM
jgi:hypothetical protein